MGRSAICVTLYLSIRLARLKSQEYRFGCETFSSLLSSTLPLYPGLPTEQDTLPVGVASVLVEEKAMANHSSTLVWKIPWTEEPGRLQSMGSLWVRHDWVTSLSLFTFMHWRRKWQPTPVFLPGESQDGGAWWAAVYGVAQSQIRLKCLSSSSRLSRNSNSTNCSWDYLEDPKST